ncbi:hypothetical protein LS70_006725 [Helicobacter sp. MIT 11-5569]|uniref:hypothetical protein n=1 Tax=Helicobacter sp. MIT 11-5569 TaxID=1548151 RepID=UPI00051FA3B3|nr:hypothetical protein [Helicobacter sp. MIT 11-5569]TLD82659.1 hypothetical protein LS70_006725 [Helicobacter sp. MIT 11-5569]
MINMKCYSVVLLSINKTKKWIKSAAGVVSVVLFITSIILLAITWSDYGNFSERVATNINNILFGLATNLLGIIVTVSFVQYFIDRQSEKDKHRKENLKIKRYDRIMRVLLERYLMYFKCLTTPIEIRNKNDPLRMLDQFKFEDMCDLYRSSLYICEGLFESSIELFYESEEILRNYMVKMIQNINFKYNEQLKEIIMDFVEKSIEYDVRGAVLRNMTTYCGEKRNSETIMEYIKDTSQDWIGKEQRGKLNSNIMLPYTRLYKLLKIEIELIKGYEEYMNINIR